MKAVILVGGKATRLEPLTINIPKAMVPVLNTPFLEYAIRHLSRYGIMEVILAQGHLAQPIESYLGDGRQVGVRLNYSTEDTPLGSAGAVKNAERYLDETFLVLNGDVFTDLDFTAMIDWHQKKRAKATIAITPVDDPTSYGLVETDTYGRVTRFLEKPSQNEVTTNMINAGAWLLEPAVLSQIPPQTQVSFERNVFPQMLGQGEPFYAYPLSGYWMDMGTPEKYLQLHRDLLSGRCQQYRLPPGQKIIAGEGSQIHPTVKISGPAVIGANCSIGRRVKLTGPVVIGLGAVILEDSAIEESVIWRNIRMGPKALVKNSILADNCHLEANSIVEGAVLGDDVVVERGGRIEPGSRIWPGTRVAANPSR
jgi:mannose-1-phosphate guanylyltransferase